LQYSIFIVDCSVKEWTDVNLKWNESEYGSVADIRIPPGSLWKPDILMYNRSVPLQYQEITEGKA
jgi:hypothetical protein